MPRKYKKLSYEDRKTLEKIFKSGGDVKFAAETLGVHRDTIYKELSRCKLTKGNYNADAAQKLL